MAPTRFMTDQEGRIRFNGFLGDYELDVAGWKVSFSLNEKGETGIEIRVPPQHRI